MLLILLLFSIIHANQETISQVDLKSLSLLPSYPQAFTGDCSGHYKISSDIQDAVITTNTRLLDSNYSNSQTCYWLIQARKGYGIQVFSRFIA